ncbi:hypothetical protein LZC95_39995 [Pendulispora brunnea]|uniref:DUF1800 domain-containing protein n=1 Tax=Pendulispora brunnea TaxID=2905690 RepID=A0ABZ2K5U7_9BACT
MKRAFACALPLVLAACGGTSPLPEPRSVPGRAVPVDTARALPEGHPEIPLADPASNDGRVGRAPHRLSVEQLRASLLAATGYTWMASRVVNDPDSFTGTTYLPDADMLEALAATLGRPDYVTSTSEAIEPAVTFSKLAGDAARSSCRMSVKADTTAPEKERRILRHVTPKDTLAANSDAIKKNLSYLALRFWGRTIAPNDAELAPLLTLFGKATAAPGTPVEGWRAVCIAMATDPQFLTY